MANIINPQLHAYGAGALTPPTSAQFQTNYRLFSSPAFTDRQRRVLAIMGLIPVVSAQKNYAVVGHAALIADAAAWGDGLPNFDFWTAWVVISLSVQYPNQDITALLNAAGDFLSLPENTLERMNALLYYRSLVPI